MVEKKKDISPSAVEGAIFEFFCNFPLGDETKKAASKEKQGIIGFLICTIVYTMQPIRKRY